MNLLRAMFGNRRKEVHDIPNDRRATGPIGRAKAAADRKDSKIDELCRTVSMSRADFEREMAKDK